MLKSFSPKPADLTHDWYLIDAEGQTLGRLASVIAHRLQGKHKPTYAPHVDNADNLVVVNTAKIKVTGNKLEDKKYYRHSGYPGGIKETGLDELMLKDPNRALLLAVKGMLPKNRLQAVRLQHLKLSATAEHAHSGQSPKALDVKQLMTRGKNG